MFPPRSSVLMAYIWFAPFFLTFPSVSRTFHFFLFTGPGNHWLEIFSFSPRSETTIVGFCVPPSPLLPNSRFPAFLRFPFPMGVLFCFLPPVFFDSFTLWSPALRAPPCNLPQTKLPFRNEPLPLGATSTATRITPFAVP